MANEQLKVNSKTTIEEFKRKHNILVEGYDDAIANAVDEYLQENPVDITALEGKTINPARVNTPNINGEVNPSVKPLYYHPIIIEASNYRVTCVIINNQVEAYTLETFKAQLSTYLLVNLSGAYVINGVLYSTTVLYTRDVEGVTKSQFQGAGVSNGSLVANPLEVNLDSEEVTFFNDGVNKIN